MIYDFEVTVTAGTALATPKESRLKLTHGVIHQLNIDIPPGPRGELYFVILVGGSQLYPHNQGGYFRTDNRLIAFNEYFELTSAPYELTFKGWAPTAAYDHTVHIEVGLIESKIALASLRVAKGLEKFFTAIGLKV